jgi:DNA polymerase-3 subunit beta
VQLTTSDLEIQIRTTAELDGDAGNFTTTVGARKLIDILRTMPSDQTVVLESSQNKLILKGGKSKFTLADHARGRLPGGAGGAGVSARRSACRKRP